MGEDVGVKSLAFGFSLLRFEPELEAAVSDLVLLLLKLATSEPGEAHWLEVAAEPVFGLAHWSKVTAGPEAAEALWFETAAGPEVGDGHRFEVAADEVTPFASRMLKAGVLLMKK